MTEIQKANRKRTIYILILAVIIAGLFLFAIQTDKAAANNDYPSILAQDGDDGGDANDEDEDDAPGLIEGIFTHVVSITSESLYDVWVGVLEKSSDKYVEQMEPKVNDLAALMSSMFNGYTAQGLEGLVVLEDVVDANLFHTIQNIWQKVFNVALIFFPLAILVNVGTTLTSGISAPVARAEMLEGLVKAMVTLGFCAGSFIIGAHAIKVGWGLSEILRPPVVDMLFSSLIVIVPLGTYGIFGVFIVFLVITIGLMIYVALILSHYAVITITIALLVIAPLVIIIGNFKPFNWMYWMWIKGFTVVLLVPAANALLLLLWQKTAMVAINIMSPIISQVASLGFLGLLISLNFTIGKLVYQPFMEAVKKSAKATKSLAKTVVAVAGAAVGAAGAAGAIGTAGGGSAGAAGIAGGGAGGAGWGGAGGSGWGGTGGSGNPYAGMSETQQKVAGVHLRNANNRLNQSQSFTNMALRNNPVLRGASNLFFDRQRQSVVGHEAALQAASESEQQRPSTQTNLTSVPASLTGTTPFTPVIQQAMKRNGSEPEFVAGRSGGRPWSDYRTLAYKAAGNIYQEQKKSIPEMDQVLERAGVSEGQYMAALAFRSSPSAFKPAGKNAQATLDTFGESDANGILSRFEGTPLEEPTRQAMTFDPVGKEPGQAITNFYQQLSGKG